MKLFAVEFLCFNGNRCYEGVSINFKKKVSFINDALGYYFKFLGKVLS